MAQFRPLYWGRNIGRYLATFLGVKMFYRISTVLGAGDAMHVDATTRDTKREAVSLAITWARSVCGTVRVERVVESSGERVLVARVRWTKGIVLVEPCQEPRPYVVPEKTPATRRGRLRRRIGLIIDALR